MIYIYNDIYIYNIKIMIKFVCCLFSHDMRVFFTCLFRVYLRFAMETLAARHIAIPSAGVRCISTSAWNSWRR